MVFLFILQDLPFSSQKAKGVDELVALSHKTAVCTRDIISYVSTVNIVNRVFARTILMCHYITACNVFTHLEARTD